MVRVTGVSVLDIRKEFKKIQLPIHNEHIKPQYYDPFRKRLISITPEEKVRQKTAYYLRDVLKVPEHLISTEDHLSHYGIDSKCRADIVIGEIRKNNKSPFAVIECKSEDVQISDQAFEQVISYAFDLKAQYALLCDGIDMLGFVYDDESESYSPLKKIPSYMNMVKHDYSLQEINEDKFLRTPFKLLANEDHHDPNIIGEDTPSHKRSHIRNIAEAFMDCSRNAYPIEYKGLKIVDDLGISYRRYGDASGSNFGTGYYRMILTEDETGESIIYGFSIQVTGKTFDHPKYGNQSGKSVLIVSKSGEKKDVMVVQINLNEALTVAGNGITITHSGITSMKYANVHEFKELIDSRAPDLLRDDQIVLGTLPKGRLLYLDMERFVQLLVNLIRYCNIRDEYKEYLSRKRKEE